MIAISEALNRAQGLSKGHRLLAQYLAENGEKAAFMTSFQLASVNGLSQSTVMRFVSALGYEGYHAFQEALRIELKYRLDIAERYEVMRDITDDRELLTGLALTDGQNVRKTLAYNSPEGLAEVGRHLLEADRVFTYGQGFTASAAFYLASYLGLMLPNVTCLNMTGMDIAASSGRLGEGDVLISMSFPLHQRETMRLLHRAVEAGAVVVTITEAERSEPASAAQVNLVSEWGELGVNGSMAPLVSLCSALVCILARQSEAAGAKLRARRGEVMEEI